ncbi:hypothetical protein AABB24_022434 [Solanum stoloniferum]|uniref:Uncharacterized protein n=1 Tax=Solanum stoloniferum TaxID=62892 RepID=A0ABD2SZG3_9SOLN
MFIFILQLFPFGIRSNACSNDELFLATNPELSGLPPRRLPPPVPISTPSPILPTLSTSESIDTEPFEELSSLSKSQSLSSTQQQELTMLLLILCLDCRHLLLGPHCTIKGQIEGEEI